jgi:TRAP-type C4-dicarboxylate transport system permease small subunit
MRDRWERMDETIDRVEQTLLITLLSFMILTAFFQIILRNAFATGLTWGDSLVRNLVLWIGFIGATLATREGKHISLDVFSRWFPSAGKPLIGFMTDLFSFFICGLLAVAALKFIRNEIQMGTVSFLGIPSCIPEAILPLTFGLMTLRFGLRSFRSLSKFMKAGKIRDHGEET